jgi:hypothetical protein
MKDNGFHHGPLTSADAEPREHDDGTRGVHPGRARRGGPATCRPASVRDPRQSAPYPGSSDGGATQAGRDERSAVACEAGDAVTRLVSIASARVIASRMAVSCPDSIDFPAPEAADEENDYSSSPEV